MAQRGRARPPRSQGERGAEERPLTAREAIDIVRENIREITNGGPVRITSAVPTDEGGWVVEVETVEDRRIPSFHDAVISAIARIGPVVPMRMATVFLDDRRVGELLAARHGDFVAALDRVTARDELGVKAFADPKMLTGEHASGDRPAGEKLSGTAYLMRRRRALASQDDAFRIAAAHAERIHAGLLEHAVDGKRKPASDQRLSGRGGWTVLNGTYLVDKDNVDVFRAMVATIDRNTPGIELEITGPWPPYSFAGDVVA